MVGELIAQNFNENIEYLQASQETLFNKLAALESAIENGYYREKYELVYENDYFDVFEKDTKKYLYGKNSSTHAKLAAQSIDYKLDDNLFECFIESEIESSALEKYRQQEPFTEHMSGFAQIIHYTKEHAPKEKNLKTIDKFIFFGVGLGLHISSVHNEISSKVYFIIEDDLELFRLSLFTTNYAKLASDSHLVFSVFEDKEEFFASAKIFLDTKFYYNHYIKYFHLLSHSEDKLREFQIAITSQAHLSFYYNTFLLQSLKPLDYIFDNYKFLDSKLCFSDVVLDKEKFLLLGAGPSLQKNIKWLRENHNKFIVVAVAATLEFLQREKITPNIIVHLDAHDSSIELFNTMDSMDFIKEAICFFSDKVPTEVINKFDKKNVFLFENGTTYKEQSLKPAAPCVGSIAYQILVYLGVKNLYMLGLDLSVDSKTGKTHIDSYVDVKTVDIKESMIGNENIKYSGSLYAIEGNLTKEVYTNPRWQTSINSINTSTKLMKKKEQNIFNLSDGVKFAGIETDKGKDVDRKNIKDIQSHIFNICEKTSSVNLKKSEIDNLNAKLLHAKRVLRLLNESKDKNFDSIQEDIENILKDEDIDRYELSRTIAIYMRYILSYIFDFMNSQELENEDKHFKKLYNILLQNIEEIITYYSLSISARLT